MSEGGGDNIIGVRTVYEAVLRLEGKLDGSLARVDAELEKHREQLAAEVGAVRDRQNYLEGKLAGSIGMVKWLGPTGVAALAVALARVAGVL